MKTVKVILAAIALTVGLGAQAQTVNVDTAKSSISWLGKKVGGEHSGTIKLKSGELKLDGSAIAGGEFVVDMNSLACTDLTDAEWNGKLVGHLKSDDFFGVEKYPEAKLVITNKAAFSGDKATVTGDLTIKAATHPVSFVVTKNGNTYTAEITVDRSKYDVRYGSKSFFDNLGDKVIYDDFYLTVNLVVE
ncbi:YceI family protein [Mangrovibacterium marinum]|uniref:Polyisoprenoid-binding protein YceI n=1 Tax=Mangrovibacterium marinum TaxID=1639118 RepID=A0A2T5C506_9BACT|nr:YceI family protein [Mangrovibacterium marinum]PTN09945.1 polyisoprenoid-binding protein YceI [Mangrovibacterium marinum]|eukprot:Anaeramoba_ignava/a219426_36.p2 GENE.a219426_36~~a219426_36.p2  ORF type:complete len:190 (+),score=-25.31 a219426_36:810-1379(+)